MATTVILMSSFRKWQDRLEMGRYWERDWGVGEGVANRSEAIAIFSCLPSFFLIQQKSQFLSLFILTSSLLFGILLILHVCLLLRPRMCCFFIYRLLLLLSFLIGVGDREERKTAITKTTNATQQ